VPSLLAALNHAEGLQLATQKAQGLLLLPLLLLLLLLLPLLCPHLLLP
jgi:hypothetical protein